MKSNIKYLLIMIISIVISVGIYVYRANNIQGKIPVKKINRILPQDSLVSNISITNLFNEEKSMITFPKADNLFLILIRKGDCYDCYKDIPFWNTFDSLIENTNTFIVVQKDDTKYMKEFVPNHKIELPVIIDDSNNLFNIANNLSDTYTPLYLFVRKDGKILSISNSNYGFVDRQESYIKKIKQSLNYN